MPLRNRLMFVSGSSPRLYLASWRLRCSNLFLTAKARRRQGEAKERIFFVSWGSIVPLTKAPPVATVTAGWNQTMKTNAPIWLSCAVLIAAVICVAEEKVETITRPKPAAAVAPAAPGVTAKMPAEATNFALIGHLETRDKIVTIQSGANGLRYLVKTKEGKVLHENLSEEQLKAQAPEIHELIKMSVAGKSSRNAAFMDARVERLSR